MADEGGGSSNPIAGEKTKVVAGILAILLGGFAAHKFYLGYKKAAIIHLCLMLVCLSGVIGLVEGIIYLTKSDEDFKKIYVDGTKEWF